jgi:aminopeptidase
MVERKIRIINLPIGIITPERARTYGFNYQHWHDNFVKSINVDHSKMGSTGMKLASKLQPGKQVKVTANNGTNLTFKLSDRPVHIHDGIIDRHDVEKGTPFENLPAGVIEHSPDENTVEGVIQFDQPAAVAGKVLKGLRWEFGNGHLVKYSALEGLEAFKGLYENASGEKDRLADIAIGLNPHAELIGFFTDRIVQGTVSIGIGGNTGMGGKNSTVFGNEGTLRKPTLEIDGHPVIVDGKIQV